MKAAVIYKTGDIRYAVAEDPRCGEDDVIVKVTACGICGSDSPRILTNWKYPLPGVPGHEFSGVVVEKGRGARAFAIGDPVVVQPLIPCNQCAYCKSGDYSVCDHSLMIGADLRGGYAEYARVPAANLLKADGVAGEEAALIEPCAVALYGVFGIGPKLGDTVAVLGMGTIGQMVLQWLKLFGVGTVVAVDISEKKLAESKALGADICLNARTTDVAEAILAATDGRGVDIALETAGSKITQEQCLLITRKKGKVGYLGIARSDILLREKSFENIFRHELTVKGFWNSYTAPFPGAAWAQSIAHLRRGKIKAGPLVSHRFALEDAADAFAMIREKTEEYNKILLIP